MVLCKLVQYGPSFFFPLSFTRTYFILTIVPVGHAKIANFLFGLTVQSCLSLGPPSVNRPADVLIQDLRIRSNKPM